MSARRGGILYKWTIMPPTGKVIERTGIAYHDEQQEGELVFLYVVDPDTLAPVMNKFNKPMKVYRNSDTVTQVGFID